MKKLVIFCILVCAFYFSYRFNNNKVEDRKKTDLVKLNDDKGVSTPEINSKSREGLVDGHSIINLALDKAHTLESYETAFLALPVKEINSRLLATEGLLKENRYFQQANSKIGLDQESAIKLVELIRTRQALNKVHLDRQLEAMRRKYL